MRQIETRNPDHAEAPVVGLSESYPAGESGMHSHTRSQLIYAVEGSLTILTEVGSWVLPPSRALLVPGSTLHALKLRKPAELRTLYIDHSQDWIPERNKPIVVVVPTLLRELILAAVESPWDYGAEGEHARLARVLIDRLGFLEQEPVHLPDPSDPRARRLAQIYYRNPADRRPLGELAAFAGASIRTLERLFLTETGFSPGGWVQQLRLMFALEHLADGMSVGDTAFRVGFENPSSFIAAFRRHFGQTPARYFELQRKA